MTKGQFQLGEVYATLKNKANLVVVHGNLLMTSHFKTKFQFQLLKKVIRTKGKDSEPSTYYS